MTWVDNDLTQATSGTLAVAAKALGGYWGTDSSQHVNYIDGAGPVHELYICPFAVGCVDNDLTQAGGAKATGSPAIGTIPSPSDTWTGPRIPNCISLARR